MISPNAKFSIEIAESVIELADTARELAFRVYDPATDQDLLDIAERLRRAIEAFHSAGGDE